MVEALLTILLAALVLTLCSVMLAASVLLWMLIYRLYKLDKDLG